MRRPGRRVRLFLGASGALLLVVVAFPARHAETPVAVPAAAHEPSAEHAGALLGVREPTADYLARQRRRSAELVFRRDPFQPPALPTDAAGDVQPRAVERDPGDVRPQPRLSAVSTLADSAMAIVGREIVRAGDHLSSGHTVLEIGTRSVTLARGDERLILTLGDER